MPSIAALLLADFDRETLSTRRALEQVPEGMNSFKPHEKSMELGYLAGLVATMPAWVASMVNDEGLDFVKPGKYRTRPYDSRRELLEAFEQATADGRSALAATSDAHLQTTWKMFAGGHPIGEQVRHEAIRSGALNHLYHHRGQLTVYLRLTGQTVPGLYGPSADEQ